MNIETSAVKKIKITDIIDSHKLDPITVILEDIAPRQGKIIIECYGQSWSAYWGGMGDRTIAEFFCSCDEHYISNKLSSIRSMVTDYEAITDMIKGEITEEIRELLSYRRDGFISADKARDKYNELKDRGDDAPTICDASDLEFNRELMCEVFGDEWRHDLALPQKSNPDYQYLCRIITAVQEALRASELSEAA